MKITSEADVDFYLEAYVGSAALGAALELGLLWLLAEKPLSAAGIAQELNIPIKRCRYWLQILSNMGLIDQVPGGYVPSSIAKSAILNTFDQEIWALSAREARERFPSMLDLAVHIREPGSTWASQGRTPPDYVSKMVEDPQTARTFTRMLYEVHRNLANQLALHLDMTGVFRLMDLGGGSGVVSMALLRKHPELTSVVVDIENVCVVGQEIARENSLADRISYYAADFLHDELPGEFDMVLVCDVGVFDEALFRKLWAALKLGGRFVIVEHFAPEENVAPPQRLHWAFRDSMVDPDFSVYTLHQIKEQLSQVGFELLPMDISLPGGRIVIQARK